MSTTYHANGTRLTHRKFYSRKVTGCKKQAKREAHKILRRLGKLEIRQQLVEVA